MGFWQPVTNLKDYVSQKNPPAVTFFLCLLTLAISFIYLSFYSQTHTLPNPDIEKDWNNLLSSLSQLQLCVKNSYEHVSPIPSHLMEQEKEKQTPVDITETFVTYLHLKVPLIVTSSSAGASLKGLGLHTTLSAKQLNIGGGEIVNVTLEFLSAESTDTCLTISAPKHLLPMILLPPECPAYEKNVSFIYAEPNNQLPTAAQTCYSLQSKKDPTLTVMLTKEEQSVAVQHLLEVSLSLLGVCFIICLAVSLRHSLIRRNHWNGLDLQKEPLIEN